MIVANIIKEDFLLTIHHKFRIIFATII